jgi:hypothetical protein
MRLSCPRARKIVEPAGAEGVESVTTASIKGHTVPRQTDGGVGVAELDRAVEVKEVSVGTTAGLKSYWCCN